MQIAPDSVSGGVAAQQGRFDEAVLQALADIAGMSTNNQADAVPPGAVHAAPIAQPPESGDRSDLARLEPDQATASAPQLPTLMTPNVAAAPAPEPATPVSHVRGSAPASKPRHRPDDDPIPMDPSVAEPIAAALAVAVANDPAAATVERASSKSIAGPEAPTHGAMLEKLPPDPTDNGKAPPAASPPAAPSVAVPAVQPRPATNMTHAPLTITREPSVPTQPQAATVQPPNAAPSPHSPAGKPEAASAPASPAAQLAPVLVSVLRTPSGAQHLTVRLQPAELGQVEVRVDRTAGGPVRVDVTVQRPETLTLLLRDQPQLQRALDQAGLPADGRSVAFHVATPPPGAASPHSGTMPDLLAGGGSGGGAYPGSGGHNSGGSRWMATAGEPEPDDTQPALVRWLRTGIDITA